MPRELPVDPTDGLVPRTPTQVVPPPPLLEHGRVPVPPVQVEEVVVRSVWVLDEGEVGGHQGGVLVDTPFSVSPSLGRSR